MSEPSSAAPRPVRTRRRTHRVAVVALLVVGVLCLLVELLSPSRILWTGERVVGSDEGGIVYYTVNGQERTLDAPGDVPPTPVPVTVYADPDDSTRDRITGPAKWFDAVFVLGPFVAAGVVWVSGLGRRRTRRRA